MFESRLDQVRHATSGERVLADIVELTHFHRIQASPGYDAAADWLEQRLGDAGLTPERVWTVADGHTRHGGFPMPEGWHCRHARATLHGAQGEEPLADYDAVPLSIVQRSTRASGRYPLVACRSLEELERIDVRGKVVLHDGHAQRAHERAVVAGGAVGMVCDGRRLVPPVRTEAHDRGSIAYTSFWWLEDRPRGWGVVVSPDRGREIRQRLAAGERIEVEVDFDCDRFAGRIPITTAVLRGELPGEVLVTSHLCHPRPGANDNASGSAATLECARVLATLAASGAWRTPRRSVRFLWMPEFTGTYAWQALRPDAARATLAAVNLDMVGERQDDCGSRLCLERAPHFLGSFPDELLARILGAARSVSRANGRPARGLAPSVADVADVAYSGGSDHALWIDPAFAVPCPMLIQWPDRYYHSDLDTPERCDPASLALVVETASTYAAFLAEAGADEVTWLLDQVVRGARSRLLAALAGERAGEAARAELERAERSLASIGRLAWGQPPDGPTARAIAQALPLAEEQLVGVWESEIRDGLPIERPARSTASARVPARRVQALLCPMRWLAPGWDALGEERQRRLLALEAAIPGGTTALDVAWFAVDGSRDADAIAACVAREGWAVSGAQLDEWLDFAVALGFCEWAPAAARARSGA